MIHAVIPRTISTEVVRLEYRSEAEEVGVVEAAAEAADARKFVALAMPDARLRRVDAESALLDARDEVATVLEMLATMGTRDEDATTAAVAATGVAAAGVVAAAGDAAAAAGELGAGAAAERLSSVSRVSQHDHVRRLTRLYASEVPETTRDLLSKVGIRSRLLGSYRCRSVVDSDSDLGARILGLERDDVR